MAKAILSLVFLIWLTQGCTCAPKVQPQNIGQREQVHTEQKFALTPQKLLATLSDFSYHSNLQLSLSNADRELQNNEQVTIRGAGERVHMSKKIDDAHFFEIMNEKDLFLVKNRHQDWRSGNSNKAQYQSLLTDGLNLLPWLIEQFSLESLLKKQQNSLEINNQPVPPQAPFVKLLKIPPKESSMTGRLELDPETGFLRSFSLTVNCTTGSDQLTVRATISLSKNTGHPLIMPSVNTEEPLSYPVNIATRFKNLMEQDHKQ